MNRAETSRVAETSLSTATVATDLDGDREPTASRCWILHRHPPIRSPVRHRTPKSPVVRGHHHPDGCAEESAGWCDQPPHQIGVGQRHPRQRRQSVTDMLDRNAIRHSHYGERCNNTCTESEPHQERDQQASAATPITHPGPSRTGKSVPDNPENNGSEHDQCGGHPGPRRYPGSGRWLGRESGNRTYRARRPEGRRPDPPPRQRHEHSQEGAIDRQRRNQTRAIGKTATCSHFSSSPDQGSRPYPGRRSSIRTPGMLHRKIARVPDP